jgi:hypothetical protein
MPRRKDERQEALVDHGEDLGAEKPLIYVAMPLSQLPEERREKIELLAFAVNETIQEQTRSDDAEPWPVRVHSPIKHSAPWKHDDRQPEEIYELNTDMLWLEADAMVVIADKGGSFGMGQELVWACSLQLPVLILHRQGTSISRQARGAGAEHDIEVAIYKDPEHLRDLLDAWLVSRRAQICDGPRRRIGRRAHLTRICSLLGEHWEALDPTERHHAVMTTRLPAARVERILSDPLAMAAATVQELVAIGCAVGIDLLDLHRTAPLPELAHGQREALAAAATEFGWSAEKTLLLHDAARVELGRGGVRRLPLSSNNDWLQFSERDER